MVTGKRDTEVVNSSSPYVIIIFIIHTFIVDLLAMLFFSFGDPVPV